MRHPRLLLTLVVLVALLAPSAAQAGRVKVSGEAPASAPNLAGDQVVYLRSLTGANEVRLAAPGAAPRTLRTFGVTSSDDDCCTSFANVGLATSATRLATLFTREDSAKGVLVNSSASLEAGPLAGPAGPIYECTRGDADIQGGFDLDGDRLAYVSVCGNGARSVVVRDLATGADVTTFPGPAGRELLDVRLAGNFVAYLTSPPEPGAPRAITVRDLAAGTDLFTVTALPAFDLQADGKLVANTDAAAPGCPATVDWFSPAEPTRHATGICAATVPHIAGDRILVQRRVSGSEAVDLVLSDLNGNARTLATGQSALALGGADFDGTRAAYVAQSCSSSRGDVYLDDLGPADSPLSVPGGCPIAVRGATFRASGSGRVRLSFDCPRGCSGSAQIYARRGDDPLTRERSFDTGPGRAAITVKLDRRTRLALARRGRLKARVVGESSVLDSRGSRTFGRKVTLLAPRRSR